ncbi:TDT family transporter [Thermohalobacter berrensis]|uniref:C4-dicarboxylate ABC transporter n=1 Tax=Thermohalobacter berrensis TaxID=99594 RepID=A0A419T7B2_9FIRM|nr:TDT family transporter [Thermohalobacter berrensis]RKD33444.1 C4-dicarboxylate ABC transporter [Thermohalobacter berrensis]
MVEIIKKTPIPIAGLMLALAATGNLVASYGNNYKNIFGYISFVIFILLILKLSFDTKTVIKSLENPVVASVSPTFSMGIMILSTYIKTSIPSIAYLAWVLGLVIHSILIIYFTKKFILKFDIKKVFPSYFVVYVGIVVGSVTAPAYNAINLGKPIFWFGFISYLILLPIVIYRVFLIKSIKEPALPTITIFAAPASLCLAGYMSSFQEKNMIIVNLLTLLSLVMLFSVLIYMPKMLKTKFYPSYSAFTFPCVISAIAIKKTNAFFISINNKISFFKYIVAFEETLAVLIVLYVLFKYTSFLLINRQEEKVLNN